MSPETSFTIAAWVLLVATYAGALASVRSAKVTYPTQIALTLGFLICWSALEFSEVDRNTIATWISGFAIANSFLIGKARADHLNEH